MADRESSPERCSQLEKLADSLGVKFRDIGWLDLALTHTSYANEAYGRKSLLNNERLEFLGDAVLEIAVSTYLFDRFPRKTEGELTKLRAATVCEETLSKRAKELGFGNYILLGRGESMSGGKERPSTLEDAFEAVIGAIYKDQGWEAAQVYVLRQLKGELDLLEHGKRAQDFKTTLQELVQQHESTISYVLLKADGPDHAKVFEFAVEIDGKVMGIGTGHSKKAAEQQAACMALKKLKR